MAMEKRGDSLLVVGLCGLALLLVGALLGERAAPLALTGLLGTLLAAGGAAWRAVAGRRRP